MDRAIDLLQTWEQAYKEAKVAAMDSIKQELPIGENGYQYNRWDISAHPDEPGLAILAVYDKNDEPLSRRFIKVAITAEVIDPDIEYKAEK